MGYMFSLAMAQNLEQFGELSRKQVKRNFLRARVPPLTRLTLPCLQSQAIQLMQLVAD